VQLGGTKMLKISIMKRVLLIWHVIYANELTSPHLFGTYQILNIIYFLFCGVLLALVTIAFVAFKLLLLTA